MTSYLNSLSGHVANIRRLIPTSLSPDSDLSVNDPEDSHVSRVLRAYYTEKGRPFPSWLGPDPRAPQQAAPVYANMMPSRSQGPSMANSGNARSGRGLGDLFGDGQGQANGGSQQEPMSLRQPRRPMVGRTTPSSSGQFNDAVPAARPLPGDRANSYQSRQQPASGIPANNAALGGESDSRRTASAQDRLKARFGGGGGRSGSAASNRSNDSGAGTYGGRY